MKLPRQNPKIIHASCVDWLDQGVLIQGPSGSGKSDLVIRLIDAGAKLVADDLVEISFDGDGLIASAPKQGRGLIELRGQGIYGLPYRDRVHLGHVVQLVDPARHERLPQSTDLTLEGFQLPVIGLQSNAASAVARLRIAISTKRIA